MNELVQAIRDLIATLRNRDRYLDDFRGHGEGGSKAVPADTTVRLPDEPCKFVQLHNWTVTEVADLDAPKAAAATSHPKDAEDGTEIYYGLNGKLSGQLFAGDSTVLLPIDNANQISVRAVAGASATIHYTIFR